MVSDEPKIPRGCPCLYVTWAHLARETLPSALEMLTWILSFPYQERLSPGPWHHFAEMEAHREL